jgi:hypothetical protein
LTIIGKAANDGDIIEFFDTQGTQVTPNLTTVQSDDIRKHFCMECIDGKKTSILFGLRIQTTVPIKTIKHRVASNLKAYKTFIRIHTTDFTHGVNWVPLGFFVNTHDKFNNRNDKLMNKILNPLLDAWETNEYWTIENKQEIATLLLIPTADCLPASVPFTLLPSDITSTNDGKMVVTTATTLYTPAKFSKAAKKLIHFLWTKTKTIPSYTPLEYK